MSGIEDLARHSRKYLSVRGGWVRQHAVASQYVLQLVVRQGRDGPVIRARHRAGGDQRIDDGLLNALYRRFEQGIKGCAAQTLDLGRLAGIIGPVAVVGARIGGGEGDEDVAGPIALDRAKASQSHRGATRQTL